MQQSIAKIKKIKIKMRANRVRAKIKGTAERPRLSVFKSNQHVYVQLINDDTGSTVASASDLEIKDKGGNLTEKAKLIGSSIAKKAKENKISEIVFDRGSNKYHGIVKALADSAREGGLKF